MHVVQEDTFLPNTTLYGLDIVCIAAECAEPATEPPNSVSGGLAKAGMALLLIDDVCCFSIKTGASAVSRSELPGSEASS